MEQKQESYGDFKLLKAKVVDAGLFTLNPMYEALKISSVVLLYAFSWYVVTAFDHVIVQFFNGVFLALVYVQIAFIVHDVGHRQVSHNRKINNLIGTIGASLLTGNSYTWWVPDHNKHHSSPNIENEDPDINFDWIAFSEKQALEKKGFARFITKYQAYLFFPLTMLEGLNLRQKATQHFIKKKKIPSWEFTLFCLHFILYVGILFTNLSIPTAIIFIVTHQLLFGLFLSSTFATNHKGMDILDKDDRPDFISLQVLTARNVRSNWFTDLWYGGLNFQIEHHLFPTIPRRNYRKVQEIVKKFCKEKSIRYKESGIIESYREILSHLHKVGRKLRQ